MPIPVISSFSLKGKFPIDERMIFETIEDMKNYSKNFLPGMYFCFVKYPDILRYIDGVS